MKPTASGYDRSRLTKLLARPDIRSAVARGGSVAKLPSISEYDRELLVKYAPVLQASMNRKGPGKSFRSLGPSAR